MHDQTVIAALEPGQLSEAKRQKLPRRVLGRGTVILLVMLRLYVLAAVPLVGYAFVRALQTPP